MSRHAGELAAGGSARGRVLDGADDVAEPVERPDPLDERGVGGGDPGERQALLDLLVAEAGVPAPTSPAGAMP